MFVLLKYPIGFARIVVGLSFGLIERGRSFILIVCLRFLFLGILGKILFSFFGLLDLALFFVKFAFEGGVLLLIACAAVLLALVGGLD